MATRKNSALVPNIDPEELEAGGNAFRHMLGEVHVDDQIESLKKEIKSTTSVSKRDAIIKKLKYLSGLKRVELDPGTAYVLHNMPVIPPSARPVIPMGGNRIEYADVNNLYKDHMLINEKHNEIKDYLLHDQLVDTRKGLYEGAKAIFGLGEAVTGESRGKTRKGLIRQISGDTGPKQGLFHSKLLSKKQDFSGRATIYAEPNLGFNEMAVPKDMLWSMYKFHVIRDMVRNGHDYVSAKKGVESRNIAATNSFNKMIKEVPIIANRAPTLMRTNITAFYPVPVEGKTLGYNPQLLSLMAGDFDGDALSVYTPMTPDAVREAKEKLLAVHHIHDYRKGQQASMVQPGHEAVLGGLAISEPDMKQKTVHFKTEADALKALQNGEIKENTPIVLD